MTSKKESDYRPDTDQPQIAWDEEGLPHSTLYNDVYYSTTNALAETEFVFLDKNKLRQRWTQLSQQQTFTICETGFGAGLNFLSSWALWRALAPLGQLHFISIEKYPLNRDQVQQAHAIWPQFSSLSEQLLQHYPPSCVPGFHHLNLDNGNVKLTLIYGDVKTSLEQLVLAHGEQNAIDNRASCLGGKQQRVNAWYFDGFTPAKNPEMWQPQLFQLAAKLSADDATFATFTSARSVRDGIEAAGFKWNKVPGYGLKREMLYGQIQSPPAATHPTVAEDQNKRPVTQHKSYRKRNGVQHSWHLQSDLSPAPKTAIVIGAGLAGCHAANALARRGVQVTLIDKASHVANGASGNLQGLVYTRLSLGGNPLARFNMAAQLYADRYYHQNALYDQCGQANGVFHLATNSDIEKQFQAVAELHQHETNPPFKWIPQNGTEKVCGVATHSGGLLVTDSGWINPIKLCRTLVQHPLITPIFNTQVDKLTQDTQGHWHATTHSQGASETQSISAEIAIICTAGDVGHLTQTAHIPVRNIRGQVSHIESNSQSEGLKLSLCGAGYIAPAQQGVHCTGASFNLNENTLQLRAEDHIHNINNLQKMSSVLAEPMLDLKQHPHEINGRVGFRGTTPDYFPIVGAAPKRDEFCEVFAGYRKRAATPIPELGPYHKGLYVSVGYGSRGLAYTPLATEILCSSIFGNLQPTGIDTILNLHPARFLFRDLTRNRI